ncbi:MAG: Tex-like N-terminal domain-containing protein, partial [Thiohalocapsa sp.]
MQSIVQVLSQDLSARPAQVEAAIELLDGGATVPFIARYRKEATGGLDDAQLRLLEERLTYLRELESRRATVLASLKEQGKLTDALREAVLAADSKQRLEDLYLPYRPKRRTKAQMAREAGLEPLADALLSKPELVPDDQAADFVRPEQGVADTAAALEGARQILMERTAEDPELVGALREALWQRGVLKSQVLPGQETAGAKFSDYFEY